MMISRTEIESLVRRQPVSGSPVLSVYLDVDQSKARNLNLKYQGALKDILRSIEAQLEGGQLESFSADAAFAQDHVSRLKPSGKGLVLFADVSDGFFWLRELQVPVRNAARWSE